jgi:1-acyl-sn-glycerol-3-phosphate acyltransferase
MSVVRSLVFYVVFYGLTVPFIVLAVLAMPLGGARFRAVPNAWSAFHRWCVRYLLGIEVRVVGKLHDSPALYALKHESFFEALDLACLLSHPVAFAKAELFEIPLWGRAARAYGTVPVSREEGAKALRFMLSEAKRMAASGRPLAIFPEGTRVAHGSRPPLRSGFAGLYKLLGLPVVPVAVNSGLTYAGLWKKSGTIILKLGDPIPPGLPREEVEARVRDAINALND